MEYTYIPRGTCSRRMTVELEDGIIKAITADGVLPCGEDDADTVIKSVNKTGRLVVVQEANLCGLVRFDLAQHVALGHAVADLLLPGLDGAFFHVQADLGHYDLFLHCCRGDGDRL